MINRFAQSVWRVGKSVPDIGGQAVEVRPLQHRISSRVQSRNSERLKQVINLLDAKTTKDTGVDNGSFSRSAFFPGKFFPLQFDTQDHPERI